MPLASGVSSIFPLVVHQTPYLANSAVTLVGSVHKSMGDDVSVTKGHNSAVCDLASTLCKHDLFILSWAWVRPVRTSISSELLMCGGGVRSILLLPLVAIYLETIDVYRYIWHMFVFMSVVVTV